MDTHEVVDCEGVEILQQERKGDWDAIDPRWLAPEGVLPNNEYADIASNAGVLFARLYEVVEILFPADVEAIQLVETISAPSSQSFAGDSEGCKSAGVPSEKINNMIPDLPGKLQRSIIRRCSRNCVT